MRHMTKTCPCGEPCKFNADLCLKCRRESDRRRWKQEAAERSKGKHIKPVGVSKLMLHYNDDDLRGKRKQSWSERPLNLDATDFIITQGHRKPNAQ